MPNPSDCSDFSKELHPLITQDRVVQNGYYMVCREYQGTGEVECCAIRLDQGDSLKRGGGAGRKNDKKQEMDESTFNKSISRAKTAIRRKSLALQADRMLTLTFKENVTDITEAWAVYKYFCKLMKFRYREKFRYVAVPELQKRGAVHFHIALSGFYHLGTVRRLWKRAAGKRGGSVHITSPRKAGKNSWNPKNIAVYIAKYISKADIVDFNKRRYSSGGDIPIPEPERGWLALGVPVVVVMRQIIEAKTRKQMKTIHQSDGYLGIIYCST